MPPPPVHDLGTTADLVFATFIPDHQSGPVQSATLRRSVALQRGPERPSGSVTRYLGGSTFDSLEHRKDERPERSQLNSAFKRAALAATGQSVAFDVDLAEIAVGTKTLNDWARAGMDKVEKMPDEQLNVDWVYGMLELLKRLTVACVTMRQAQVDKSALEDFLVVSAD